MVQVYCTGRGVGRCLRDHREHVCQRRPALRWRVHRLVGRSLPGVSHLQLVRLLLVLGHSGCGAVKAARGTAALSPQQGSLLAVP